MENKTWNQYTVKKNNKTLVLSTIKESFPISRAKIAELTSLNKGTVSSLVNDLITDELIYESGPGESSGGRRPVMLHFNEKAGYTIGVDLGVNYILGIITDLNGNVFHEEIKNYNELYTKDIKSELFKLIDLLIRLVPECKYKVIGIGVGVPGTVDSNGKVLLAPNLNWENIPLKELLEEKYHLPVVVENEANSGAYGEKRFGIGLENKHIIYISIGMGIGVGLLLNGELYRGVNGFAGELGHMSIDVHGKKCRCGRRGCWELYASEQALNNFNHTHTSTIAKHKPSSINDFANLAAQNNSDALDLISTVGNNIGLGINNIINIFNPEQIIIGGRITVIKPWLKDAITNQLNQTQWYQKNNLDVNFSQLNTYSTAIGVSAFVIDSFTKNILNYL